MKMQEMLQRKQWNATLYVPPQLGVWDVRDIFFADLLVKGGAEKDRALAWLSKPSPIHKRIRNSVATVLLRRSGDVENAPVLLAPLGFSREQIEHNRALIERVDRIKQALKQTGALPEGESLENLELLGYVRSSYWISALGHWEFPIQRWYREETWIGMVMQFRLQVEQDDDKDGRKMLQAVDLWPAE